MDGYRPLIDAIREIVGRVALSHSDEQLAAWALSGPIVVDEGVHDVYFSSPSIPDGRLPSPEPDSEINIWTPDRRLVVELALRTTSARAKRWIVDEQRLVELPANYHYMIRHAAGGERFRCEISVGAGWIDLLLAVDDWLIELGEPARWGQIKEKYGSLRAYPDNALGDLATDIIDHAENVLSKRICETCGAPGQTQDRDGWYYTACRAHVK